MKKNIFIALAFLCIQSIQATSHENGFKHILSLVENENGLSSGQEDELARLQEKYKNICVVCNGAIALEEACKNLTISCVDQPRTFLCKLRGDSLDAPCDECPEVTFVFQVHKECEFSVGKYFCLKNTCNFDVACKAFGVCCFAGGLVFVITTSCIYALM